MNLMPDRFTLRKLCHSREARKKFICARPRLSGRMIERFTREKLKPKVQQGEAVNFKRRKPDESEIGSPPSLQALHDWIRMLDADGYPHAFLNYAGFRFEFSRSALYDGRVVADVKITPIRKGGETRR